jgi:excisionase family DNA binding protein
MFEHSNDKIITGGLILEENYLNVAQAAKYLTLAKSTMYQYIHYRVIPYLKIGQRIVFSKNDLDKWIMKHKKKEVTRK